MSKSLSSSLVATAVILAAAALPAQHDGGTRPQDVKGVMTTMTIPGSDVVFGAASEPPQDDAAWTALREGAQLLADSGRLLMTVELARDTGAWMEQARELVSEAETTRWLAEAKNRDGLEDASDQVYATCKTCHARYLAP